MPVDKDVESKARLDTFFTQVKVFGELYCTWTKKYPTKIHISPDILAQLSRIEGFYQREELKSRVTEYAPVVRYFDLSWGVVTIIDDWEEKFFHFD